MPNGLIRKKFLIVRNGWNVSLSTPRHFAPRSTRSKTEDANEGILLMIHSVVGVVLHEKSILYGFALIGASIMTLAEFYLSIFTMSSILACMHSNRLE